MIVVKEEEEFIVDVNKVVGFVSPSPISERSFDTINTPTSSSANGRRRSTKRSSQAGWTEEEDSLLCEVVKKYNGKSWKKVAECIPGRSDVQCLHRWQKVLNPELVKGPWLKEEDDRMIKLVEKYGCKKWSLIAKFLPGRIGKQCRERTDNAIKNHWNCSVRKKFDLNLPPSPIIDFEGSAWSDMYNSQIQARYANEISHDLARGKRTVAEICSTDFNYLPSPISSIPLHKTDAINTPDTYCSLIASSITSDTPLSVLPINSEKMHPSPKRRRVSDLSTDSGLSLSKFGFCKYSSQAYNKNKDNELPPCPDEGYYGNLHKVSSPDLALSISVSSSTPESMLKNSASSYTNTPSIIRKRIAIYLIKTHQLRLFYIELKRMLSKLLIDLWEDVWNLSLIWNGIKQLSGVAFRLLPLPPAS